MCHELLTQRALFSVGVNAKKGHAESAFCDACHTSSGPSIGIQRSEGLSIFDVPQ